MIIIRASTLYYFSPSTEEMAAAAAVGFRETSLEFSIATSHECVRAHVQFGSLLPSLKLGARTDFPGRRF